MIIKTLMMSIVLFIIKEVINDSHDLIPVYIIYHRLCMAMTGAFLGLFYCFCIFNTPFTINR